MSLCFLLNQERKTSWGGNSRWFQCTWEPGGWGLCHSVVLVMAGGSAGACAGTGTQPALPGFLSLNSKDHHDDKDPSFPKLQYLSVVRIRVLDRDEEWNSLETKLTGTNLHWVSVLLYQWVESTDLVGQQKKGSAPACSILATLSEHSWKISIWISVLCYKVEQQKWSFLCKVLESAVESHWYTMKYTMEVNPNTFT